MNPQTDETFCKGTVSDLVKFEERNTVDTVQKSRGRLPVGLGNHREMHDKKWIGRSVARPQHGKMIALFLACAVLTLLSKSIQAIHEKQHRRQKRTDSAFEHGMNLTVQQPQRNESHQIVSSELSAHHNWSGLLRDENFRFLQEVQCLARKSLNTRKKFENAVMHALILNLVRAEERWITDETIKDLMQREREQLEAKLNKQIHRSEAELESATDDALEEEVTEDSCSPGARKIVVVKEEEEEKAKPEEKNVAKEHPTEREAHELPQPQIHVIPIPVLRPPQSAAQEREEREAEEEEQRLERHYNVPPHKHEHKGLHNKREKLISSESTEEGEEEELPAEEAQGLPKEEENVTQEVEEVPEEEVERIYEEIPQRERKSRTEMHEAPEEKEEIPLEEERETPEEEESEEELEPMLPPSKEITHHERKHVEQEPGKVVEKAHEERERRKHAKEEKGREERKCIMPPEEEKETLEPLKAPIPEIPPIPIPLLPKPKIAPEDLEPQWPPGGIEVPETPYVNPQYSPSEQRAVIAKEEAKEGETNVWTWVYLALIYPLLVGILLFLLAWFV